MQRFTKCCHVITFVQTSNDIMNLLEKYWLFSVYLINLISNNLTDQSSPIQSFFPVRHTEALQLT